MVYGVVWREQERQQMASLGGERAPCRRMLGRGRGGWTGEGEGAECQRVVSSRAHPRQEPQCCRFHDVSHLHSYLTCFVCLGFLTYEMRTALGLPWWLSSKEPPCQCRRHGFDPWVRKMPWRRKCQPTLLSLPGESHGQRSLMGYSPRGRRVGHD